MSFCTLKSPEKRVFFRVCKSTFYRLENLIKKAVFWAIFSTPVDDSGPVDYLLFLRLFSGFLTLIFGFY